MTTSKRLRAQRLPSKTITVKHAGSATGSLRHSIAYLTALPRHEAERFEQALREFSRPHASIQGITLVSCTLRLWFAQTDRERYPLPPVPAAMAGCLVKNLRRLVYETGVQRGHSMFYTNSQWSVFRRFLRLLAAAGGFPELQFDLGAYAELPYAKLLAARTADTTLMAEHSLRPKNIDFEGDRYHTDVLVPISIHESDHAYLDRYQTRLEEAVGAFRRCALREFEALKNKHSRGLELIQRTDFRETRKELKRSRATRRVEAVASQYFCRQDRHPNLLGNLLALVTHEMDGIPTCYQRWHGSRSKVTGPRYWRYVTDYGKNELLPYLGILTTTAIAPLIVLLILENPRLNVHSLLLATLEERTGKNVLLSCAGEEHMIRMTVKKPRAQAERHSVLSPVSIDVIRHVVLWTSKLRERLRSEGRLEESRCLWLSMSSVDFTIRRVLPRRIRATFRYGDHLRTLGKTTNVARISTFIERNRGELAQWANTATLKALRVSQGVLEYLRSEGSVRHAAIALGHRRIQTTIDNYIPRQIQELIYERQMRRHQNLLIVTATADQPYLLETTDFATTEELHGFLGSLFPEDSQRSLPELIDQARARIHNQVSSADSTSAPSNRVLLLNDPQRLAVALLYSERAGDLPPSALDRRDTETGATPRMWHELVTALRLPLPDSWREIKQLVVAALEVAEKCRPNLSFPQQA